jgi:hypothetical protein
MSEVRRTAALASPDFRLDPTGAAVRPVLRARFGPRLVPPSTDGLASEKGLPGTATVADISLRIVAHGMRCQVAPVRIARETPTDLGHPGISPSVDLHARWRGVQRRQTQSAEVVPSLSTNHT